MNLRDELSGGGKDKSGRVGLSASVSREGVSGGGGSSRSVGEGSGEDGEEETTSLTGTGLSTGHQVSALSHNGDRIFLNGGGGGVEGEADVLEKSRVERRVGELSDRLGDTLSGSLDGDRLVLVKVDTGVLQAGKTTKLDEYTEPQSEQEEKGGN